MRINSLYTFLNTELKRRQSYLENVLKSETSQLKSLGQKQSKKMKQEYEELTAIMQ